MKISYFVASAALVFSLLPSTFAQPSLAGGPPKWFHHDKRNPNQSKVHHPKPAHQPGKHSATKMKAPKGR